VTTAEFLRQQVTLFYHDKISKLLGFIRVMKQYISREEKQIIDIDIITYSSVVTDSIIHNFYYNLN